MIFWLLAEPAAAADGFCPSPPGSDWISSVELEARLRDQGLRMVRLRISQDRCYDVVATDDLGQSHSLLVNPVTARIMGQKKR